MAMPYFSNDEGYPVLEVWADDNTTICDIAKEYDIDVNLVLELNRYALKGLTKSSKLKQVAYLFKNTFSHRIVQDTVVYIPDYKKQKEYWAKKEQVTDKEKVSPMHDTTVAYKTQGFKVGDRVVTLWGK